MNIRLYGVWWEVVGVLEFELDPVDGVIAGIGEGFLFGRADAVAVVEVQEIDTIAFARLITNNCRIV